MMHRITSFFLILTQLAHTLSVDRLEMPRLYRDNDSARNNTQFGVTTPHPAHPFLNALTNNLIIDGLPQDAGLLITDHTNTQTQQLDHQTTVTLAGDLITNQCQVGG
jgi:hypothetical protein